MGWRAAGLVICGSEKTFTVITAGFCAKAEAARARASEIAAFFIVRIPGKGLNRPNLDTKPLPEPRNASFRTPMTRKFTESGARLPGNRGDSKRPCPAKETLIAGELAQDGASRHYLAPMRRKRINRKINTAFLAFERSFQRWINFVIKHEGISQPLKKQRVRLALGRPARTILQ